MDHVTSLRLRVKGLSCFEGHLHLNAAAVTTGVTSSADLVILDGLLGTVAVCGSSGRSAGAVTRYWAIT